MEGFVKFYRQLKDWEWYKDQNTKDIFLHCLLCANYKPGKWEGIVVEKGSFITSSLKLSKETGISRQCVRTSLKRLKSTNELTTISTNEYTIITIVKWIDYQGYDDDVNQANNQRPNKRLTNVQPTTNQRLTTNKNEKNEKKKINEKSIRSPIPFGCYNNVKLTPVEYEKLGNDRSEYVSFLDEYIEEKGYKSKNHNLAIHRWVIKAVEERKGKGRSKSDRQDNVPTHNNSVAGKEIIYIDSDDQD